MIVEAVERQSVPVTTDRRATAIDVAWAAAALALVASTVLSAQAVGGDAEPIVLTLLGSAAVLLLARLLSSIARPLAALVVVGVAAALLFGSPASTLSGAPRAGPFGYSSITGAFFAQAGIAALMLAMSGYLAIRVAGIVAAVGFAWVTVATQTRTSAILLVAVVCCWLAAIELRSSRRIVVAIAAILAVSIVVTIVLGSLYTPDRSTPLARLVDSTVTERRQALWHDAVVLTARHPLLGVGPERFGVESPVARSDPDEPWAHEEFLQASAEMGVLGGVLLAAVFGLGFARVAVRPNVDAIAVLGAAALAILGVHACIEYVLQRPAVPLAAAALVGVGIGPFRFMERTRARHARP
jgi:O-antigen ligase